MARPGKLSKASKRRILVAQQRRLQRDLDRVSGKLEACMSCDLDKLRRELGTIEQSAERERMRTISRLGLRPEDVAELMSPANKSSKKAAKKTAKKKKSSSMIAPQGPKKTSKKKTSKKKSSKKIGKKKTSKKKG